MPCYRPLTAFQRADRSISFKVKGDVYRTLKLPCGQCIGCRLSSSREKAVRCMNEASLYEANSFVTLTYDEDHLPDGLVYRDFQLFMKRLRKRIGKPVRFFMCGEYGTLGWRPHFHAILFNLWFDDTVVLNDRAKNRLYRSATLEKLWPFGYSSIGEVSFESAAYVARYVCKKVTDMYGDPSPHQYFNLDTGEVFSRKQEFGRMSLRPGIGAKWYEKYSKEVRVHDGVIVRGFKQPVPAYYDKLFERVDPEAMDFLRIDREIRAAANAPEFLPERLAAKECVASSKLSLKRRKL